MNKPAAIGDAGTLGEDIPCCRCGYNLRGLTPPGDCPECGWDLRDSLHAHRLRPKPLPPPDPAWAGQIREGAWLALAAFVVLMVPVFAPFEWFRMPFRNAPIGRTPGRVTLLSFACVGWVLAWASAWKLTARERDIEGRVPPTLATLLARLLGTAFMLTPFAWAWSTWSTQYPSTAASTPALLLWGCGLFGTMALLIRIGQLMKRRGAFVAAAACYLLAVVSPLSAVLLGAAGFDGDPSSLGLMLGLSSFPGGSPLLDRELLRSISRGNLDVAFVWLLLLLPLSNIAMALRLRQLYPRSALEADEPRTATPG